MKTEGKRECLNASVLNDKLTIPYKSLRVLKPAWESFTKLSTDLKKKVLLP